MTRNLVVCCDGTWNTPTQKDRGVNVPSNVVKMARAIREGPDQVLYYDTGVGTGQGWDKWTGGALGTGLTQNIKEAYAWIARNLQADDRLFLFGFSRGAYTVRSLGGLIGRCGLTNPDPAQVDQAYELYRKAGDEAAKREAAEFKKHQRTPDIYFLGVWDTVGSLGVPAISRYGLLRKTVRLLTDSTVAAHGFHDETLGHHVHHAYHALAIDERRGPFEPSVWKSDGQPRSNVEQVWFAGAHCNIGGGYIDPGLSDHAFMWMAVKAMDAGLHLDERYLAMRVDPNAHGELRDEYHGLYKFMKDYVRPIGLPDTLNEKIHASVLRRMSQPTNDYRPANVQLNSMPPVTEDGLSKIEEIRAKLYGPPAERLAAVAGPERTLTPTPQPIVHSAETSPASLRRTSPA
jgi:uncharacterized protein (DUF2235 family)